MMDFEVIQNTLQEIFGERIDYMGKNIQTGYLEYMTAIHQLTPKINAEWTKNFPSGSYFSIGKSSNEDGLDLVISISDRDYDNYFTFIHPEVKLSSQGIVVKQ